MQISETLSQDLHKQFTVTVAASELEGRVNARLEEMKPKVNLKGFRPGKVPPGHVRRLYGKALMGEVIEKTLNETSQKVLNDNRLRVASQPDLKPSSDMDAVLAGQEDLRYALEVEIMPEFDPTDIAALELTRLVYRPTEAEIDEAVAEVAKQNRTYAKKAGKAVKKMVES